MNATEAILTRRSVRAYAETPVSDSDLTEILTCGCYAPSAVNLQPWYFLAIRTQEQMEKLCRIMGQVSETLAPYLEARFSRHPEVVKETTSFIRKLGGAPVCLLVFQNESAYTKTDASILQSVAAAIENVLLAAWEKGIASCWLTAPLEAGMSEELRRAFAPEHGPLAAMVTLGYPAAGVQPKVPRRKDGRYALI